MDPCYRISGYLLRCDSRISDWWSAEGLWALSVSPCSWIENWGLQHAKVVIYHRGGSRCCPIALPVPKYIKHKSVKSSVETKMLMGTGQIRLMLYRTGYAKVSVYGTYCCKFFTHTKWYFAKIETDNQFTTSSLPGGMHRRVYMCLQHVHINFIRPRPRLTDGV